MCQCSKLLGAGITVDNHVGALVHKFLQSQRKQETFVKPKIKKTIRSLKVKPLSIARSKAWVTLFVSTSVEAKI
jgi:hypothetical protein